ncbi:MAG TPA: HIT family protein [Pyrinomonadaceae bacterium]|nr:HIT family protein [Pyrinomonadaceae bacterium]
MSCLFCGIAAGEVTASIVFEDQFSIAFLDHRPLFPGHCLVIPKAHFETLTDLPADLMGPFFKNVQMLAAAVQSAMQAQGSFVAINNRVSQSVPHVHVHIAPRTKGDGLKGFFWPRSKYKNETEIAAVQQLIQAAVREIKSRS